MRAHQRSPRAFTLIELLVVISIIAILIGIAMPSLAAVRRRANKLACSVNLRSIGQAIQMYRDEFKGVFPKAKYMPDPFVSADSDPPLTQVLDHYLSSSTGQDARNAFRCPSDTEVFPLSSSSYMYQTTLSGVTLEAYFPVAMGFVQAPEVVVARDFDGGSFDTTTVGQIIVGPFHGVRNLLFADGHAGNF